MIIIKLTAIILYVSPCLVITEISCSKKIQVPFKLIDYCYFIKAEECDLDLFLFSFAISEGMQSCSGFYSDEPSVLVYCILTLGTCRLECIVE